MCIRDRLRFDTILRDKSAEHIMYDGSILDGPFDPGFLGAEPSQEERPVSYTHLDVYKRQEPMQFGM